MEDWIPHGWSLGMLAYAMAVFLVAGAIKGIAGAGLPTVALALLALAIDLKQAIAILIVPTLITNFVQAVTGGAFVATSRRLAPMLIAAAAGIWLGVEVLVAGDARTLSGILGVVLICYAAYSLATPQLPAPSARQEAWLGPVFGVATGVLFGFTGSFLVPGVLYMQALGLPRDRFVQAMGIAFSFASVVLFLLLAWNGLFTLKLGAVSAAVCVPAVLAMAAGQRLRRRLSEEKFRKVFFVSLLVIALYIVWRAFL
jgi:uncharacterized membrane protein YfcA